MFRCYASPKSETDIKLYKIIKYLEHNLYGYKILIYGRLYHAKCWFYDNGRHTDVNNSISTYYLTLHRLGEESVHCNVTLSIKYSYTLIGNSFRKGTVGYTCRVEQCVHSAYATDSTIMSWRPEHIVKTIIYDKLPLSYELTDTDVDNVVKDVEYYHNTIMSPPLASDIMHDLQRLKRNIQYVNLDCKCSVLVWGGICRCGLNNDFW